MKSTYNPADWYWIIGGDQTHVWSSARATSVEVGIDHDYAAWVAAGHVATSIATEADLAQVLAEAYPRGMLATYAADVRWRKEVGGITFSGVPVATDDRSKQMVMGSRLVAMANPEWTTQWVGADGSVYPVDAATMIAISDAVAAHVSNCFDIFATVKAGISAVPPTITTHEQIDAAFGA